MNIFSRVLWLGLLPQHQMSSLCKCLSNLSLSLLLSPSSIPPPASTSPLSQPSSCLVDIWAWMSSNTMWIDYPLSETSLPPGFFTVIIVSPILLDIQYQHECLGFLFFYYLLHVVGNKISSFNLSSKCLIMSILTGNIFIQIFINFILACQSLTCLPASKQLYTTYKSIVKQCFPNYVF